ncbi:MAG: DEAD/DEAH box helicase family protein [Clostridia bacterium]|nr:DEAD/DEAH box helicase family protein [Clostridia bacterium]
MVFLFDHQKNALEKLHSGSILCGGVGSGKSITGIAWYWKNVFQKKPVDLYIITTARKRDTLEWDRECARFGLSDEREKSQGGVKVTIDSWNNIGKYTGVKGCFFLFDEQRVVGYGAWVKSFLKITKENQWLLLSATPGDTWMDYIPVFIANGFYKNKTEFVRRHVIYNRFTRYPQVSRFVEEKHLNRLRASILVTMDFTRQTIAHHERVVIGYDREKYDDIMRSRWNPYKDQPIAEASELCQTLRRVVDSDPGRLAKIREVMKSHPKVIIFYCYDFELEILRTLDVPKGEWNGHKHEPIPDTDSWAYLVQYTAGAEGWNCTTTDTIIFYSQSYSYKQMVQAAGRIDRLNTPFKDLWYYHLVSMSKIDMAISRALRNKKNFNENAFLAA